MVPEGEPADDETVAGVTATANELYACYNANAFLQVFALHTDEYMARSFAEEGITEVAVGYLAATLEPNPPEAWQSIGVQDVTLLPDGRVGALLVGHNPVGAGVGFVDYYIFIEQDGRYLIDEVVFPPAEGG